MRPATEALLADHLRQLKLTAILRSYAALARQARENGSEYEDFLDLAERYGHLTAGQAAEIAVREAIDEFAVDAVTVEDGDEPIVRHRDGRAWRVGVETSELPARPASWASSSPATPGTTSSTTTRSSGSSTSPPTPWSASPTSSWWRRASSRHWPT